MSVESASRSSNTSLETAAHHTRQASKHVSGDAQRLYHLRTAMECLEKATRIEEARKVLGI